MSQTNHRFRQVHLDFHTALECKGVGEKFDAQTFVDTLKMGHVNAINIFAKCHHGYSYYPTKVGTMHPELKFDLLGAQIEALHRADIKCPIYVSVKWDDLAGKMHPEWICVNKEGKMVMRPPLSGAWGWSTMDISSGYADYFAAQVEEICDVFGKEIDGWWFDICFPCPNYSPWGLEQMVKAGVNVEEDDEVMRFARQQDLAFFKRITDICKRRTPQATWYFNGTSNIRMGEVQPYLTHVEVESLPTSGGIWGYMHFPIVGRQARSYGKEIIGMTGRFHRSWADFGGLKTQDQLDYECGTILGAGGRICVGDQLHPNGVLDPAVYRLLGKSFSRVEKLEPWLYGAAPAAEVGVLALGLSNETRHGVASYSPDTEGAAQILLEAGIQFDIVDAYVDLSKYAALILPDSAALDEAWLVKLKNYLDQGGKLVVSGTGALDSATKQFQLKEIPVEYVAPAPTIPSYLHLDSYLAAEGELADDYDYVYYYQSHVVRALPGAEAHGDLRAALFNRTWEHYTSHQHAPVGESLNSPLVVSKGNVLYFSAPLFGGYREQDYWAYRAIAVSALRKFLPPAALIPNAPGWVEFTLHIQAAAADHPARKIVHIVAYHPRRSSQSVQHVDQSALTAGLSFKLKLDGAVPQRVYLAPEGTALSSLVDGNYLLVQLPPVGAHTVVVVE